MGLLWQMTLCWTEDGELRTVASQMRAGGDSPCCADAHARLQICWPAPVHDRFAGGSWIKARSVAVFRKGGGLVPIVA